MELYAVTVTTELDELHYKIMNKKIYADSDYLTIYYLYTLKKLEALTDELPFDAAFEELLKQLVLTIVERKKENKFVSDKELLSLVENEVSSIASGRDYSSYEVIMPF